MKTIPCIGGNHFYENKELSFRTCRDNLLFWTFTTITSTLTGFSVITSPPGTITIDWGDNKPNDTVNSGAITSHNYGIVSIIGSSFIGSLSTIGGGALGGGITLK